MYYLKIIFTKVGTVLAATAGLIIIKYALQQFYNRKKEKCIIIQTIHELRTYKHEMLSKFKKYGAVGIDCEWVTVGDKRNPVSLLQLANKDGFCALIRLSRIPVCLIPPDLIDMFKDRSILKVGVGVNEDAGKLFHDYCLEVEGFIDLRFLAKDLPELEGKPLGLKSLAEELLNYKLNKSKALRCSNWDAEILSSDQIAYAADDAIISAKLFEKIKARKLGWSPWKANFNKIIDIYIDIPFKQSFNNNINQNYVPHSVKKSYKSRYSKPRQRPMYDNCQLVAPDGELLCSCDRGKAEWYVFKSLGDIVCEEPFTVKLNFEPSGRPKLDNIFYTMEKANCCVVCGKTENYHRKLVIPSEYRKYFPDLMKKNLSHDVLLLCVDCHKRSNILDQQMRLKLAEQCDAPLINSRNAKYKYNPELARVKSAATALTVSGSKIPEARKKQLEKIITDYYQVTIISKEILEQACSVDVSTLNKNFIPHGLKVYQYFCKNGGVIHFEKMWRQHFLDTMQPKFLPDMWSVEHNHKRLALQVINHEREVDFDVSILGLSSDLLQEIENYQDE